MEESNCKFLRKNPQVHLIILREWPERPKNDPPPPILRNLDNFPPGAFYSNPPPPAYDLAQKSMNKQ